MTTDEPTPIHDPIYFKGVSDQIEVEVAFQFVDAFEENVLGFCNNIFTQEGGTHLAGFKTRFTQMIAYNTSKFRSK